MGLKDKEKAYLEVSLSQLIGPKHRKNKNKKKKKKPMRGTGNLGTVDLRDILELRKFQKGETSSAGASSSAVAVGAVGVVAPSILGKYKWVSKAVGYANVGSSSLAAHELKRV